MKPTAALVFALTLGVPTAVLADALEGAWRVKESITELRFQPCGDATCGVLTSSKRIKADPEARDTFNKTVALRTRKLKGIAMLDGLKPAGDGWKGKVYLASSGDTYGVTIHRVDANTLSAKGCAAPLLCQTNILNRIP